MRTVLIGMVLLSMQATIPTSRTPLASLAGNWATTVAPEPGNAPIVAPSFKVDATNDKVSITFQGQPQAIEASMLLRRGASPADDVAALLIKYPPAATSARRVILRPVGAGQLRYEMYVEFTDGRPGLYYEEVFKKAK